MASAVWLPDPAAADAEPSDAIQSAEEAVEAALVSDRFLAFTPVAQRNRSHVLLVDAAGRDWVEVRFSVLYTLKEWRRVCTQNKSTHDSDFIWGPKISDDDAREKGMTPEERDAYRYAAHVVRHRGVGGSENQMSEWTLRDSSAGILSTQLCTAKVVEVPPRDAHERGVDYFGYPKQLFRLPGRYLPHDAFPLLELECTEGAKWHDHVFVLAVYSTAYGRDEYNQMCTDESAKARTSRKLEMRPVDAALVNFPLTWKLDAELCESIPLTARRVTKWGHVGPLLDSGKPGFEVTVKENMPRWLVAHRIMSNSQTKKSQCTVEALSFSGPVADGSAIRTLEWNDGARPRMIVRSECEGLLAALINAKRVINDRYVSTLRIRAAIEAEGLHVLPPEAAAPILDAAFGNTAETAKATQRAMHEEALTYQTFFARNMQQQKQADTAYGAAKRTHELTVARTMSERENLSAAAAKRKKGGE